MITPVKPIKKVLLVYLGQVDVSPETPYCRHNKVKRTPSLGLLYLAEVLNRNGYIPQIKDQSIEWFTLEELADYFEQESFDCLGIYSFTATKKNIVDLIHVFRARLLGPILVGGPGSFAAPTYLKEGCDMVCMGEGEEAILEMLDCCRGKRDISTIKGISYLKDGEVITTAPRPFLQNIDSLPFPKRDYYPIKSYYDYHFFGMKLPYTTCIASRGCPHECSFCNSPHFWRKEFRLRSPENVLSEIDFLWQEYRIRYIGFKDDMFGMSKSWLEEFCVGMKERNYPIKWSCLMHPFTLRSQRRKYLMLMKEAGLDVMLIGLQSVHPQVLKKIHRSVDEKQELAKTIAIAKSMNITTAISFIIGLPGDNQEAFTMNLSYVLDVLPHFAAFFPLCILDGSEIDTQFSSQDFCDFSAKQIDDKIVEAYKRYYSSPRVIVQNIGHVLRKNPKWFLTALRLAKALSEDVFCQGRRKKWTHQRF